MAGFCSGAIDLKKQKNQMNKKLGLVFILMLFLGMILIWQAIFEHTNSNFALIEVNFFDIGQGDSILIEMPRNIQVLIDGGPNNDVVEKVAKEMPFLDRKIEIVVLTHPDKDHITGLFEILRVFEIGKVLMPEMTGESKEKELYIAFQELIEERDIEVIFAKEGQKISFLPAAVFKETDSIIPTLLVFWPEDGFESKNTNDFSIVAKFSFGEIDFLLTGDITSDIEKRLLMKNINLGSEVLKVAHHGSKYSTMEDFVAAVAPEIAVILVGKNSYGHPTTEVLSILQKYDIKILRTDKNGDIKIISDGYAIEYPL